MSTAPQTLPANFNGWDAPAAKPSAPPATLPANFSGWDADKTAQPPKAEEPEGLWGKVKSFFSDDSLTKDARANYEKAHGNVGMPGASEGAGLMEGLAEYDKASGGEVGGGVHDILQGNVAKGLHRIISGVGSAAAPAAALAGPAALAAAPVTTALSVGGGIAGSKLASAGATALGATPDQSTLAGDVGGFAGGYAGAKIPALAGRAALLGRTPQEAYQSALKPSTTLAPQKVADAVDTGLSQGIPISKAGVQKLNSLLEDLQDKVTQTIGSGQGKTVNPYSVASRLSDTAAQFSKQVNPNADLKAISEAGNGFLENNPGPIPAADAQAMKVGTYRQLSSKAYGEMQTAAKESQKSLARGIKEELAVQFPELNNLNAGESRLYNLEPMLEHAVNRIGNHQLLGIGTPIMGTATKAVTGSSGLGGAAAIMKVVLDNPAIKSRLAIAVARGSGVSLPMAQARVLSFVSGLTASATSNAPPDDRTSE